MLQIEIDSVRQIAAEYEKEVNTGYLTSIKKGLNKLYNFLLTSHLPNSCILMGYVRSILGMLEPKGVFGKKSLLMLEPQEFKNVEKKSFFALRDYDLNMKIKIGETTRLFHEWITYYLHYSDIRRYIYPKYLDKLSIKTCVYCNAEFISTCHLKKYDKLGNAIKKANGEYEMDGKGRFELDHYWPKSKHPFLSISFFNLHPSCSSCNLWKEDGDIPFNLFTNINNAPSLFSFFLKEEDVIEYVNTHQRECLKMHFASKIKNYECFHVEEVYDSFKDEVEELFWKKVSNGVSYLDLLRKSLPKDLVIDPDLLHRFFYGYYRDPKDILKRPLTKMKQDIAIQLEKLAPKIEV
ncbi:MAG: hypothetical protein J6A06_03085 [Fibrobacteraceae bacterium]|jgi:hypothetical protein|nr:hypothetical protein [Fibrobacteraceae bacterium]